MNGPRAVYDAPSRARGATTPHEQLPASIPKHIQERNDPALTVAWLQAQASPGPEHVELDAERFAEHQATVADARQLEFVAAGYESLGGRGPTYGGQSLFDALKPDGPAVRAGVMVCRLRSYATWLNAEGHRLAKEKGEAIERAEEAAWAETNRLNGSMLAAHQAALNDRRGRMVPEPQLVRAEAEYREAHEIQAAIDDIAAELIECRRREQAARQTLGTALGDLGNAAAELYNGPTWVSPEHVDLAPSREAFDTIARLAGEEEAGRLWEVFEKRWRNDDGRTWKDR